MNALIDMILPAGRSAVELSFFVLLPVMIVMLSIMRLLEAKGLLDWIAARLAPVLRPIGLTGLGVFAALQINFVSFAAPVATLAMMEQRGTSDRHLAATFAMVLAMAQANTVFPMAAMGLAVGPVLIFSILGGLAAAAATYYGFGGKLSGAEHLFDDAPPHPLAASGKGVLDVINRAGAEAFKITVNALPMLVLSLAAVTALRNGGAIDGLTRLLAPLLGMLKIDTALILPIFTKYMAGGTAMLGVMDEMLRHGQATAAMLNRNAGILIHPLDLPGIAVLISAGPRVAAVWKPAACGACVGIAVRGLGHAVLT